MCSNRTWKSTQSDILSLRLKAEICQLRILEIRVSSSSDTMPVFSAGQLLCGSTDCCVNVDCGDCGWQSSDCGYSGWRCSCIPRGLSGDAVERHLWRSLKAAAMCWWQC